MWSWRQKKVGHRKSTLADLIDERSVFASARRSSRIDDRGGRSCRRFGSSAGSRRLILDCTAPALVWERGFFTLLPMSVLYFGKRLSLKLVPVATIEKDIDWDCGVEESNVGSVRPDLYGSRTRDCEVIREICLGLHAPRSAARPVAQSPASLLEVPHEHQCRWW